MAVPPHLPQPPIERSPRKLLQRHLAKLGGVHGIAPVAKLGPFGQIDEQVAHRGTPDG